MKHTNAPVSAVDKIVALRNAKVRLLYAQLNRALGDSFYSELQRAKARANPRVVRQQFTAALRDWLLSIRAANGDLRQGAGTDRSTAVRNTLRKPSGYPVETAAPEEAIKSVRKRGVFRTARLTFRTARLNAGSISNCAGRRPRVSRSIRPERNGGLF
jgi:hypothetical protein